jgi:hypothetical protein
MRSDSWTALQPDNLDDVLDFSRASENAVLESGARSFGYYLRGMGVHPARRIPKILDLVMEPCIESLD